MSRNDGPLEAHTVVAPWQEEFQAFIYGWLVQMGHGDWEPIFRWKIGSTTGRTDGKSGWIRAHCTRIIRCCGNIRTPPGQNRGPNLGR